MPGGRSAADFCQKHQLHFTSLAGKKFGWLQIVTLCVSALGSPIINTIPQTQSPKDIRLSLEETGM